MLRAGVHTTEITPPVGVHLPAAHAVRPEGMQLKGVYDPLWAKALVLDDGHSRVAIVATDLLGLRREAVAEIRALVEAECGIPGDHVLLTSTHTHSGADIRSSAGAPDHPVNSVLNQKIAGAVVLASRHLQEVRLRAGSASESSVSYNRRKQLPGGVCTFTCGETEFDRAISSYYSRMGIDRAQVQGIPADPRPVDGPIDDEVTVLALETVEGRPMAHLFNFACHPVILNLAATEHISGDWAGAAARIVESATGVPCLFLQGAAGNVRPYYRTRTYDEVLRVGRAVGGTALQALARLQPVPVDGDRVLGAASAQVTVPLRPEFGGIEEVKHRLEKLEAECDALSTPGNAELDLSARRRLFEERQLLRNWVQRGARSLTSEAVQRRETQEEVQVVKIGGAGLIALPGEFFVEFGLSIKEAAPFPVTIPVTLANQGSNYHPTRQAYDEGGYEVVSSRLAPGASETLVERALALAKTLQ